MSYIVNGKVYTEHSLMDEIVYNCKIILSGIVVKNDAYANKYETQESVDNAEYYILIENGNMTFSLCPFTYQSLKAYGYSTDKILSILNSRWAVPEDERDDLVDFTCKYFMDNFEEINDYYRALGGLPPYGTTEYDIKITANDFPANYNYTSVDFSKPLHKQPRDVIAVLDTYGTIDRLIQTYKGRFAYNYLKHLGDKSLDIMKCRRAGKWDILYIPQSEIMVKDKFKEFYNLNKRIYLDRYYSEAYQFNNEYYDNIMIINLISQTFADLIVDVPEWYIRRDIFDTRSVQYFLESYGVKYFKEIPLRWQIRIVKALNKLIKYKSSNRNNFDILDVFNIGDANIYKFYLFKKRLKDNKGEYIVDDDIEKMYELEFIKTDIDGTFDDHIKDSQFKYTYDEITFLDKYWDGEEDHDSIRRQHMMRDFTYEPTKFMTLEYSVSVKDYMFQLEYFVGMMMDSRTDVDYTDMKIGISTIQEGTLFNICDVMTLLVALTYSYDEMDDTILRPEDLLEPKPYPKPDFQKYDMYDGGYADTPESDYNEYGAKFNFISGGEWVFDVDPESTYTEKYYSSYSANGGKSNFDVLPTTDYFLDVDGGNNVFFTEIIDQEWNQDWMYKWFPEFFYEGTPRRQFGFNPEADMDELAEIIGRRHSEFGFSRGFTLKEVGVKDFIVPKKITSIEELNDIYWGNKEIYDHVVTMLVDKADDHNEYKVYRFVYEYLFTKTFDYARYCKDGEDYIHYDEVLKNKDYVLYNFYDKINSEQDIETRRDTIRNVIGDIIAIMEYYISPEGVKFLFSFAASNTVQDIVKYATMLIGFFKSYKVSFLDPYVNYVIDDKSPASNGDYAIDQILDTEIGDSLWDKVKYDDCAFIVEEMYFEDQFLSNIVWEVMDIYEIYDPDPDDDYDYDGMDAEEHGEFKEADGGHADPLSCIPYKTLNGGRSFGGRLDLWDINGSGAQEQQNMLDVDGGYSMHMSDMGTYNHFTNNFIYQINAGHAETNTFRTKTGVVRVVDRQIQTTARLSKYKYSNIVTKEDGLYMDDIWVDWEDYYDLRDDVKDFEIALNERYHNICREIEIIDVPDQIDIWIQNAVQAITAPVYKIFDYVTKENFFIDELKGITDDAISRLEEEFYLMNPYTSWGNIDDTNT